MGTDNLHNKRKAKKLITRDKGVKDTTDYVLIVCEGSKTEPNYFNELIQHYRIPSANVKITGDCGSDPVSVVEHAIKLYKKEKTDYSREYNKVFCVFDQDQYHLEVNSCKFQSALAKVQSKGLRGVFCAITSVPSFEYWLLLHHTYTTAPFKGIQGQKSSGDFVLSKLKEYWPDYEKGLQNIFQKSLNIRSDDLVFAKSNAKKSLAAATESGTDNPTTKIHELVDYLQNLQKK